MLTTEPQKSCKACGITKPMHAFAKHPQCTDGRRGTCRECLREKRNTWQRAYVAKNLDRIREDSRQRAAKTYPLVAAKKAEAYRSNIEVRRKEARDRYHGDKFTKQRSTMLRTARQRAKKRGVPFELVVADINVPSHCPVLGFQLILSSGKVAYNSATLDRIKPALGYVRGNVIVISMLANQIKSSATPEQIMKVAQFYANLAQ